MGKVNKVLLIILISLITLFLLCVLGLRLYFRMPVRSFYKVSNKEFVIPETHKGFVAQGLTYSENDKNFYMT